MRFTADVNVPAMMVHRLRECGCDVSWVRDNSPKASDAEILAQARNEQRTIVTFDKDFGELAFRDLNVNRYGVALIRVPMTELDDRLESLVMILTNHSDWAGKFTVIEPERIRVKKLPRATLK